MTAARNLLVDNCPECCATTGPLRHVVEGSGVIARYRCGACLWSWWCTWSVSAFDAKQQAAIYEEAA
jgi:hypothetical protein